MIPLMIAGAAMSVAGGLMGARAARQQKLAAQQAEELRRQAGREYATGMNTLADEYQQRARFTPVGVTSGIGRSYQDANGNMVSELSAPYQGARDTMLGLAGSEVERMQGFDPNALAASRYGAMQSLFAPDRAMQAEGMFSKLRAKGLLGLETDDGSGRRYNPLMGGMQRGWADQDMRLGLEAQDWAENQRRTGMGLISSLYGQAAGFDQLGFQNLDRSQNWSAMSNQAQQNALMNEYQMRQGGLQAILQSYNPNAVNQSAIMQGTGAGTAAIGSGLTSIGSTLMGAGGGVGGMLGGMTGPTMQQRMRNDLYQGAYGPGSMN